MIICEQRKTQWSSLGMQCVSFFIGDEIKARNKGGPKLHYNMAVLLSCCGTALLPLALELWMYQRSRAVCFTVSSASKHLFSFFCSLHQILFSTCFALIFNFGVFTSSSSNWTSTPVRSRLSSSSTPSSLLRSPAWVLWPDHQTKGTFHLLWK